MRVPMFPCPLAPPPPLDVPHVPTQVGICGEHGGEPNSVHFFHSQRFDYVSCSPFRVPIARISAGQAAAQELLKKSKGDGLYRSSITNLKRAKKKSD